MASPSLLTAAQLRDAFDAPAPLTLGLEEELMLLDADSLDLLPRALDLLERVPGDDRFKPELPAAQLEIVTPPCPSAEAALERLAAARRDLAAAAAGIGRLAAAGVHPFAAGLGVLNRGERYDLTAAEYGDIARRQLVCAFQVHVAVGGADRSLGVYNALRAFLPELAALAANAPFHEGRDTGLASIRPKISEMLPRQGVPPAFPSWDAFADALTWGAVAETVPEPRRWWWELRPHPSYGTLEIRVPDSQARVDDAWAVASTVRSLTAWLAARHDGGDLPEPVASWRIAENRWSACRDGVEGTLADLITGERMATRERLLWLLEAIAPYGEPAGLARARDLADCNGAMRQRAAGDAHAAAAWLADVYVDESAGTDSTC
jgi:glutamate---cysteine ligase / carboxylate-amine ligase